MLSHASDPAHHKKVLFINSYHAGYKGSDDIVLGFSQALRSTFPDAEVTIEYLDSKNYSGPEFDRRVLDTLRFKYQTQPFDLIASSDDYAFNVLEKHKAALFGRTPLVFCGTNNFDQGRIKGRPDFVGIDERPSFADTLELIFRLHPDTKNIIAIHDDSVTGQLNSADFREAAARFSARADFSYRSGKRMEELLQEAPGLHPGTVLVYFASFVLEASGKRISSGEALKRIAHASRVPIYGGWEFNLGYGIVGGRLINLREHGRAAGQVAVRLLRGEPLTGVAALQPSPNQYMFDYAVLNRFGIAQSRLPEGSVIINQPPTFFSAYGTALMAALSAGLFLLVLIILAKLVRSHRELQRSQVKFSTIFRNSPDLISIVEKDTGRFVEVNDAFVREMGYAREEIVGHSLAELGILATPGEHEQLTAAIGTSSHVMDVSARFRRKNGEMFPVLISLEAVELDAQKCVIISANDITRRIEMEHALRESEAHSRAMINAFDGLIYICSPDHRIEFMNKRFIERTGYDATGDLCYKALHDFDAPCSWCQNERVFAGESVQWELKSPKDNRWYQISNTPVPNADGTVSKQALITDITDRKQSEEQVRKSLQEKEVLLKEIHHRVKNNMQVISSLLSLQAREIEDDAVRGLFDESRHRITSMSLIHEKLYGSVDLAHINFNEYLQKLAAGIASAYNRHDIAVSVSTEPVVLDVNVGIPCGLIVNELVSNCFKYAFPGGRTGTLTLGIVKDGEGRNVLTVSDNGIGFPANIDFRKTASLGLRLVNILADQIHGTIELSGEGGTTCTITFPGADA